MKLYHGTTKEFTAPNLSLARGNTDFGPGFYVTDKVRMADDWKKGMPGKHVNVYKLTLSDLRTCNLRIKRFEEAGIEWAKFVYTNRRNKIKRSKYSLIIGPVADNGLEKWFSKIDTQEMTWEEIASRIEFNRFNSIQFCFMNENSLKLLRYAGCK